MLLHHYLQRKSDIIAHAKKELESLMSEIHDPKIRAEVEDWEPGDPITRNYPRTEPQHAEVKDAQPPTDGTVGKDTKDSVVSDTSVSDIHVADQEPAIAASAGTTQPIDTAETAPPDQPAQSPDPQTN